MIFFEGCKFLGKFFAFSGWEGFYGDDESSPQSQIGIDEIEN